MAQIIVRRTPAKSDVYCYDDETNAVEVNETLKEIIREYKMTRNVWVISGTHGTPVGTVDPTCKEPDFKRQDVDSANVTSKNIVILSYHHLAPSRWKALKEKSGSTNIVVLAFCYSSLWFENPSPLGNHGKI